MKELTHLRDELARNKAKKNPCKKWGFTIYRTDFSNNKLWKSYKEHLKSAIESTLDPQGTAKPVSDKKETNDPDQKKYKKTPPKETNVKIKNAFKLVVVKDPEMEGYTTPHVRLYHQQKVKEYLASEPQQTFGNGRTVKKESSDHTEEAAPGAKQEEDEEPKCKKRRLQIGELSAPPKSLPPKVKNEDEQEDDEMHDVKDEEPKEKAKRPPPREERFGEVWQDYFIHVNSDVLEEFRRFQEARKAEAKYLLNPALHAFHDATQIVAIVAEAERSDYRLRGLRSWGVYNSVHDRRMPELWMEWQRVEVSSLPALYDHLSRRPLGRAQMLAARSGGVKDELAEMCRERLYGGLHTTHGSLVSEAADHGPWYELFCFPPLVNTM